MAITSTPKFNTADFAQKILNQNPKVIIATELGTKEEYTINHYLNIVKMVSHNKHLSPNEQAAWNLFFKKINTKLNNHISTVSHSPSHQHFEFTPILEEISVDLLTIGDYQRPLNHLKINTMIKKFQPFASPPIIVNRRADGSLIIVDGQHRLAVFKKLGYTTVQCQLFSKSLTETEEADAYHFYGRGQTKLSKIEDFNVMLKKGDPDVVEINRIMNANGFLLKDNSDHTKNVRAISAIFDIYQKGSAQGLNEVLEIWQASWPNTRTSQVMLKGLSSFYFEFHENTYFKKAYLISHLQKSDPRIILNHAKNNEKLIGGRAEKHVVFSIWELYNKGRRNKLPKDYFLDNSNIGD